MNMKEKLKSHGKTRLKCFQNVSPIKADNHGPASTFPKKAQIKDTLPKDNDGDLYKSLLNDVPCTSNEKGTMTDSSLQKKCKQVDNKIPLSSATTTYSNLKNILQSISKNKADDKVPLVILSKSPPLSKSSKISKKNFPVTEGKPNNVFDFISSKLESSESEEDEDEIEIKRGDTSKNSLDVSESSISLEDINISSSTVSMSPDFRGFSTPSKNVQVGTNAKSGRSNDKFFKKKIHPSDKELEASETEVEATSLDHPYSHGSQEKTRFSHSSSETTLAGGEYQRFVNRSVFGSPSLSKNPPDIMLHNDKINILRQMSQVFNDEKSVKSNASKLPVNNNSKENQDSSKSISDNGSLNIKFTTAADTKTTKTITTSALSSKIKGVTTTVVSNKLTKNITKNAASSKIMKNVATSAFNKITKSVATAASSKILSATAASSKILSATAAGNNIAKNVITTAASSNITKNETAATSTKVLKAISTTEVLTTTTNITAKAQAQPLESLPVVATSLSHISDVEKETNSVEGGTKKVLYKESLPRKKYMTRKSSKLDQSNPVHLVSSYAVDRDESIKVQSYSGTKGEEVDVIDGFTFFSFQTESEMMKYTPPQSKRKLRKQKTVTSDLSKAEVEVTVKISDVLDNQSEFEDKSNDSSTCTASSKEENESIARINEPKPNETIKKLKSNEKSIESSAFASNDLDEYLTEHSELKISFAIPKCRATEEGVTKFDETGKPIPPPETSTFSKLEPSPNIAKTVAEKLPVPPVSIVKKSVPKLPSVSLPKDVDYIKSSTSKNRRTSTDLFVKRGGNLLPLSSVFKRSTSDEVVVEDKNFEMIYVYHRGRLLTLAGSLTKVNPTNSGSIKAKVALPRGHKRLIKHAQRVSSRKVKAVEINEDLAKFALSALKTPMNPDFDSKPEETEKEKAYVKPSKENIVDILAAKFSIDKDSKWDTLESRSHTQPIPGEKQEDREAGSVTPKKGDLASKIKWNQDDILKKKDSTSSLEQSKGFKKNINRFPSLSREMKRLNMNFVTYKESDEEKEDKPLPEPLGPCTNEHCSMGCVCDSLRCSKKVPEHCGKADCMFKCSCTLESWKDGKRTETPINMVSILNADRENDHLALKEKDFKKTIVQTGSDVYLVGGEKKKRDIRIPQRYRDTNIWKSPSSSLNIYDTLDEDKSNKENVPILPNSYKNYIKDFSLNVPWYDVNGASIWCMYHSCYDCSCLTDQSFYIENSQELSECEEDVVIVEKRHQNNESNTSSRSSHENRIFCFNLRLNPVVSGNTDKGKLTLKHWIHNANFHCARTSGYDISKKIIKDISHKNMKEGYSLPLPKPPFIMGITMKNKMENSRRKNIDQNMNGMPCSKAIFHNGLGPGLTLTSISPTEEIFAKFSGNRHLSNISFKSCETATDPLQETSKKDSSFVISEEVHDAAEQEPKYDVEEDKQTENKNENLYSNDILELNENDENKKCFSLYDMIKEEEKRGELELDLSPKEEGKAILITESRFRKLINMDIIGIIGLNKSGRCIISPVKSSEDLIKMQRLQQLISNNTIDVGPNMKEIFTPSSQLDQKVRYVMIRCDVSGRWEIVGVVQRKSKENENFAPPKPKRQKSKHALPSIIMNHLKYKPSSPIMSEVAGESKEDEQIQSNRMEACISNTDGSKTDTDSTLSKEDSDSVILKIDKSSCNKSSKILEEKTSVKVNKKNELIIEDGEHDVNLPCISGVISGNDPTINDLISSPPDSPSPNTNEISKSIPIIPTTGTYSYILNQPSGKIFGFRNLATTGESSGITSNSKNNESNSSNSVFFGALKSQPLVSNPKLLFYPRFLSPGSSQFRPNVPLISSSQIQVHPQIRLNNPQSPHAHSNSSRIRVKMPHILPPGVKMMPHILSSGVKMPRILSPGVRPSTSSIYTNKEIGTNDQIKMLLFPSTTNSGKSILVPTLNNVPVSYSWVVRSQNEAINTSSGIVSQVLPINLDDNSKSKINIPLSVTTVAAKHIPQVQTTSSGISDLPLVSSKIVPTATNKLNSSLKSTISTKNKNSLLSNDCCDLTDIEKCSSLSNLSSSSLEKVNASGSSDSTSAVLLSTSPFNHATVSHQNSCPIKFTMQTKTEDVDPLCLNDFEDIKYDSDGIHLSNSPDVKCLTVRRYENCTAVDLLVRFKSIKIHWLSGTIKKSVLLNIFKMSRKINAPVSLSAKNDTIHRSSFLGMCHFALSGGKHFPVLILGTKLASVIATTKITPQELFRSNTIKYLIKEESGELSSYTYDARGFNLIRIASKRKELGVLIHGLGEKFPVDCLREELPGIEFISNLRQPSLLKPEEEEIVISDSDDEERSNMNKNLQVSSGNVLPAKVANLLSESHLVKEDKTVFSGNSSTHPVGTLPLNLKRKYDDIKSYSQLAFKDSSVKQTYENAVKKNVKSNNIMPCAPGDILKTEELSRIVRCKPVLKIPNPFHSPKIEESQTKTTKYNSDKHKLMDETPSLKSELSKNSNSLKQNTTTFKSVQESIRDRSENSNFSFQSDSTETSPNKKQPSWGLGTIAKDLSKVSNYNKTSQPSKFKNKENAKSESLHKKGPLNVQQVEKCSLKPKYNQQSSSKDLLPANIVSSELINDPSTSDEHDLSVSVDSSTEDSYSNLVKFLEEPVNVDVDSFEPSDKSLSTQLLEAHTGLLDPDDTTSLKRKLSNREKPCPLSKKSYIKKKEQSNSTPSTPDHSSRLPFKYKSKSCSPLPKKNSPNGNRSALLSSPSSQEFQQVFSGAPQFWLMDNTEKHNTLERIRRKGLAKMLENLYAKATEAPVGSARLPPKHVILKESEKVILDLRSKDLKLAKMEILLREKKTQLLNSLSDILKDCDEDTQKQFEFWISSHISNPTAKNKFEESWKPQNVIFEDEQIISSSGGNLTVSGTDITSYFATHTAGFTPTKTSPKFKAVKSQLSRRKFSFHINTPNKHPQHSQTLKNKLTNVLKPRKAPHTIPILPSTLTERLSDLKEGSSKELDSRWIDLVSPPRRDSSVKRISSDDDSISCSSNSNSSNSIKDIKFVGTKEQNDDTNKEESLINELYVKSLSGR